MTSQTDLETRVAELEQELAGHRAAAAAAEQNLAAFDQMDFDAFSAPSDWDLFRHLHSPDPKVTMPDGSVVSGLQQHTDDMVAMFAYLLDLVVVEHPFKVGQGGWTAVVGHFRGTFTQPMPLPDGSEIPPTGKTVDMLMATFAHWVDGQIAEEILFWDTGEFTRQLGLAG